MKVPYAIVLCLLLVACTRPSGPPAPPPKKIPQVVAPTAQPLQEGVVTDKKRYAMVEGPYGHQTVITTTLTAPRDKKIYIANCNGAMSTGLQQQTESGWKDIWSPAMDACLSLPIVIEPLKSHTTTITPLSGAHASVSSVANDSRIDGGIYRVVWHGVYTSFDMNKQPWGEELPLEQRVSAPIRIAPPEPLEKRLGAAMPRPREIVEVTPAHNGSASGRDPIRLRFSFRESQFRLNGPVHLYVDREWMNEKMTTGGADDVPPSQLEVEYEPDRPWTPGRHYARVIYNDANRATHWYAWSFVVPVSPRMRTTDQ